MISIEYVSVYVVSNVKPIKILFLSNIAKSQQHRLQIHIPLNLILTSAPYWLSDLGQVT